MIVNTLYTLSDSSFKSNMIWKSGSFFWQYGCIVQCELSTLCMSVLIRQTHDTNELDRIYDREWVNEIGKSLALDFGSGTQLHWLKSHCPVLCMCSMSMHTGSICKRKICHMHAYEVCICIVLRLYEYEYAIQCVWENYNTTERKRERARKREQRINEIHRNSLLLLMFDVRNLAYSSIISVCMCSFK